MSQSGLTVATDPNTTETALQLVLDTEAGSSGPESGGKRVVILGPNSPGGST